MNIFTVIFYQVKAPLLKCFFFLNHTDLKLLNSSVCDVKNVYSTTYMWLCNVFSALL